MKKYLEPTCEIFEIAVEDIITTSGGNGAGADVGGAGKDEW